MLSTLASSSLIPHTGGLALQLARAAAPAALRLLSTATRLQSAEVAPQPLLSDAEAEACVSVGNVHDFDAPDPRTHYPEAVWTRVAELVPPRRKQQPVAIDIAVEDVEGRAAFELARRGFNVLSVGGSALTRTLLHASTNADVRVDVIAAQLEPSVVRDGAADLVTCMAGLDGALDVPKALAEAHRILKPGGKLVVAFNDRDQSHDFCDMLEEVTEHYAGPGYRRAAGQHAAGGGWAPALRAGGLFRLVCYASESNPVPMGSPTQLAEMLACQPGVAEVLRANRTEDDFASDVASLAEWRFGAGPLVLPQETRMFILEKVSPRSLQ